MVRGEDPIAKLEADGFEVLVVPTGAALAAIRVPVEPSPVDVLLGYRSPAQYRMDRHYMGKTVGRYANRLAHSKFVLSGVEYVLDANETPRGHCLHGGSGGLHRVQWAIETSAKGDLAKGSVFSPDGDQGFPGNVEISVTYQLVDAWTLSIEFEAVADRETVLSLANHAYFNLNADGAPIDNHELLIHADEYTPVDRTLIPTGDIVSVENSRYDFRKRRRIATAAYSRGYDTNFVIRGRCGELRPAAELYSPTSNLLMRMSTTQPGLQLYTGEQLEAPFVPRQGLCLEAQNFPDAPNQPNFPSARLAPGIRWRQRTTLAFEYLKY